MSRLFYPEILEAGNILDLTDNTTSVELDEDQEFLIGDGRISTTDFTSSQRDLSLVGLTSTIVHFRYSLNGQQINSFTPASADLLYIVDSADTQYNPNNALQAGIIEEAGVGFTDKTTETNDANTNDMTLTAASAAVNDAFHFGSATQFTRIRLNVSQIWTDSAGGLTIVWEYWAGGGPGWAALSGVTDGTSGYTVSGINNITFDLPNNWQLNTINSQGPYYYIRGRVTVASGQTQRPLGQQAWTGEDETITISTLDDLFIARVITDSSAEILSITSIVNNSKLVIDTIESIISKTVSSIASTVSATTLTLNDGELGGGVGGGTGSSGLVIDRGSSAQWNMTFDDNDDMVVMGISGDTLLVPRFSAASPADGRILFTDQAKGDEIGVDTLYWDKGTNRLGINVASPNTSLESDEEIRAKTAFTLSATPALNPYIGFNIDNDNTRIVDGVAARIRTTTSGFQIHTAPNQGEGLTIAYDTILLTNTQGNIGLGGAAPNTSFGVVINRPLQIQWSTPVLSINDTSGTKGLQIDILNASVSTDNLFRITDDVKAKDVLTIRQDSVWLIDSPRVQIIENDGVPNAALEIGSVTGVAVLRLDSQNGDFAGADYVEIFQQASGELIIATLSSGGDIILASKFTDPTSTGNVGIGDGDMVTEQKLDVLGNIQVRIGTPAFILKDPDASDQLWNMYQSSQVFYIGEDTTPGNADFSITNSTGDVTFSSNFKWDAVNSRLGINQGTPLHPLHIESATGVQIHVKATGVTDGVIEIDNSNAARDAKLVFGINSTDQWEIRADGGTTTLEIHNLVDGNSALSFTAGSGEAGNDITFDGNLYYDVTNSGTSQLNFFTSSRLTAQNATFKGLIKIDGTTTTSSAGGIEFQTSQSDSGHGSRLFNEEVSSLISKFTIAHRVNSAIWSESFSVTRDISGTPFTAVNIQNIPVYPDNSTAAAVLNTGDIYMETATGMLRIVF